MKNSEDRRRKQAGAVWDLIQERVVSTAIRKGTFNKNDPHAIVVFRLPSGVYEMSRGLLEEPIILDKNLLSYAKRIALLEGVRIIVKRSEF